RIHAAPPPAASAGSPPDCAVAAFCRLPVVSAFPTKQLTIRTVPCCIGSVKSGWIQGAFAMKRIAFAGLAFALLTATPATAGEAVNLMLNWTPTADHSPFYYAKAQGWYEKAGIDLTIETGKGSGVSSLKVGSGGSPFGIADLATMLVARSKGADAVAVMSIYANTGQTFY